MTARKARIPGERQVREVLRYRRLIAGVEPGDKLLPLQFYRLKVKGTTATLGELVVGYQNICLIVSANFVTYGKKNLLF